jgi:DNA end-binding protein Ku
MARAIWSGSISFGLVNVPVKVFTALREHSVHFHQLEKGTGSRIRYEKVSERSGEQVASNDIELGYELAKGRLVTVDPAQLGELRPRTTRAIDISDFVDLADIDPVYYDRTYWLAPDGEAAQRPYALLLHAMQDRQQVGIGTVVMRNKQYLAAIRPRDGALAMSTMHFADEILGHPEFGGGSSKGSSPAPKELHLATQIIDALSSPWDPGRYRDTYTEEVKDLIERQAHGEHIVAEEPEAEGEVVDLMAALEASLSTAGQSRKPAAKKSQGRKTATEKARAGGTAASKTSARQSSSGKGRAAASPSAGKSRPRKSA